MATVVVWSDQAERTYDANIEYLKDAWTDNEIKKFVLRVEYVILNLLDNPKLYPVSEKNKTVRRVVINKHITLYYRYKVSKKIVELASFWNVHQDSKKLKFK